MHRKSKNTKNMDHINAHTVLSLNANWQAIDVFTPAKAFGMMAAGVAVGVDICDSGMTPVPWDKWVELPVREGEDFVKTIKTNIRIPRVIIAVNYRHVHVGNDDASTESLARRQGFRCAYTNRRLNKRNWSRDHVIPKSRGGSSGPENIVIAHKDPNNKKADRTPEEAGMPLLFKPRPVAKVLPQTKIRDKYGIRFDEWRPFVAG